MAHRIAKHTWFMICIVTAALNASGNTLMVPSEEFPTIEHAMSRAGSGDTVMVKDGEYKGSFHINPGVTLKAENLFGAVLSGGGRGTVVTLSTGSTVSKFEIRDGTIGVFSTSAHASVVKCRIAFNQQSGILCVGHLPKIEDNVIVFNRGSGIQGWDVRTTRASISHNTIAYNDNHGISLGGETDITVEHNIIANNSQFGLNPGDENVRIELNNNNFWNNSKFTGVLPGNNISYDPMFVEPKTMNFTLQRESRLAGLGDRNQNLGARLVY
ncbi:OmpA/MotB domain protein [Chitinispirillum alkaliphilum]|nr:OmpA/MotB domain protein [Chitinispirillum alkaliphilum]